MPLYEYRCRACGTEFEQLVRWNTPTEEIECPHCGRREAEKRMSRFAAWAAGAGAGRQRDTVCGPVT
ncbi:MAG: FmdB family zinc ribbon protein [Thermoflexus sp.]